MRSIRVPAATWPVSLVMLLFAGCSSPDFEREEITVTNRYGLLHGTLTLPAGDPPHPAVLVIAGSGPTDRDGNSTAGLNTDAYVQLAEALAEAGIASLRYDKAGVGRSVGASPARESAMRFEMGAHDAALWLETMRADARLGRITIVGHSEGALLGVLAHAEIPTDALVSLAGPGRPFADVAREQLDDAFADDPALHEQALDILARLEAGEMVADVPAKLRGLFRPSIQPYLQSWMKYDPAEELSRVEVPVLIVQGTSDVQVSLADARELARKSPRAMLEEIDGMNHTLKLDRGSREQQIKHSYADPSWQLAPRLVEVIAAFAAASD